MSTDPQQSDEHFRLFVESVEDYAMFILDTAGHVVSWSAGAERIEGYSANEIVGEHFSVFYPRAAVEAGDCERALAIAAAEGRFVDEGSRVRKDGTSFWANVVMTAVHDHAGVLVGFGTITRDLSMRVRAQEQAIEQAHALSQSEQRFRLLVESVEDYAIFMLDTRGRVSSWNTGAQRIKGYSANEILGKHFSIFYPQEDVDAGKCEHELEVAAAAGRFEDEGWRLRKDGTRFWANVVITAVRDASGRLVGFGKVTRDLTARVEAEHERLRLVRAEESERQKEEFLAIMGHELRNPLAPIVTAIHIIKLRRGLNCHKEIAILERQSAHLMRLLDDLLDLSRTLRDRVDIDPALMDIGEVLADAVAAASPLVEKKRQRLIVSVPKAPLFVEVDRARMAQVFGNLLNNAAKYTDEGGEIRLSAAPADRGEVAVTIADSGIGIAPEVLPRIFELFTQGEQSLERRFGGLGIGLAVARRIVEEHRGTISAESAGKGSGSRFTVRLRRVPERALAAPDGAPNTSQTRSAARRVLVVDDNQDSAELMRTVLEGDGHEVHVAFEGGRGLELAHALHPDIAFLDIGLPGMNGFELAAQMRQIPECAAIPIIAVSGYARDSDRVAALRAGFSDHFAKPFALDVLRAAVERSRTSN